MKKSRGKIAALLSAAAIMLGSLSFSPVIAATEDSENTEQVNLLVHTDWNFKQYNDFSSFAVDYAPVKDTDYKTSDDMTILPVAQNGYKSSTAVSTKVNTNTNQEYTIIPSDGKGFKSDFTGAKEFWVWVDFSKIVFRKMCFGLTDTNGNLFRTDDIDGRSDMPYYIEDGEGGWRARNFDDDGCIEIGNYKGFIRFSTDFFVKGTDENTPVDLSDVQGLTVWYDLAGDTIDGSETFAVDHVGFAGPVLADANGKLGDFAGNGALILPSQLPKQTFDESNVKCRFGVISDTHIGTAAGENNDKLASALQQLKSKANDKLDAVLVAGDFTDYGKPEMAQYGADVVKANLDLTKTDFIIAPGNHDLYDWELNKAPWKGGKLFKDAFGDSIYQGATEEEITNGDYHTTINGFDYISVNCVQYSGGVHFADYDIKWLKKELAEANTANPGKPIYVIAHPMIVGTNWGSNYGSYWASSDLYAILKDYPQAIYFSGHLHFPLNDERTIWQGDFTTVGTGSVSYASLESEAFGMEYYDMSGSEPMDCRQFSQGLYVEVDGNNNTRITRLDFMNKGDIKDPWIISAPTADKTFLKYYTDLRQMEDKAPAFASDAVVSQVSKDLEKKQLTFKFPQAKDDDMTYSYIASFVDNTTNKVKKSVLMYSDFYRHPQVGDMDAIVQKTFSAGTLAPFAVDYENDYYIQVEAVDSYGLRSTPIKSEVYKGTPPDPNKPKEDVGLDIYPNWDFKLFNDFDSYKDGYVMKSNLDYNSWPIPGADNANSPEPIKNDGYKSSKGITAKINSMDNNFIIYMPVQNKGYKTDMSGAKEFWAWVDFSQVKFRKMFFGFRYENAYGKEYQTDDCDKMENMKAYIQDGNGGWKELAFDDDGCLPQFGEYKGFIRFSIDYFRSGSDTLYPDNLQAFKVWVSPASEDYIGKTYTVDHVGFAGPSMKDTDGKVADIFGSAATTTTVSETSTTTENSTETTTSTSEDTTASSDVTKGTSTVTTTDNTETTKSSNTDTTKSDNTDQKNSDSPVTGNCLPVQALGLFAISACAMAYGVCRKKKN